MARVGEGVMVKTALVVIQYVEDAPALETLGLRVLRVHRALVELGGPEEMEAIYVSIEISAP